MYGYRIYFQFMNIITVKTHLKIKGINAVKISNKSIK
jgi:hypothetical protein